MIRKSLMLFYLPLMLMGSDLFVKRGESQNKIYFNNIIFFVEVKLPA